MPDVFVPNDFYEFDDETFRLYYTSYCQDQQVIDITIHDNFNQEYKLSFSFTNDSGTVTRTGTGTGRRPPNINN